MIGGWHRGSIISENGKNVSFFFNPLEIKISKQTKWHILDAAGREQGVHQYGCGEPRHVEFDLELTRAGGDTYARDTVESLFEMTKPTVRGAGVDRPPKVRLMLGRAIQMDCVIDSVDATYGPLFSPNDLSPYTGKVSLKLTEIKE